MFGEGPNRLIERQDVRRAIFSRHRIFVEIHSLGQSAVFLRSLSVNVFRENPPYGGSHHGLGP